MAGIGAVIALLQLRHTEEMKAAELASAKQVSAGAQANAERIASAQISSTERTAQAQADVKLLEIFGERLFSSKLDDRLQALQILNVLGREGLGTKLANAIAVSSAQPPQVRDAARIKAKCLTDCAKSTAIAETKADVADACKNTCP